MEKLILECQRSSSNLRNEKPLIQREIGSIKALCWVGNHVFILISLPIALDFTFESYIELI